MWVYAVETAAYLKNTPAENWYCRKPELKTPSFWKSLHEGNKA